MFTSVVHYRKYQRCAMSNAALHLTDVFLSNLYIVESQLEDTSK